jgi:hypothetical protein
MQHHHPSRDIHMDLHNIHLHLHDKHTPLLGIHSQLQDSDSIIMGNILKNNRENSSLTAESFQTEDPTVD